MDLYAMKKILAPLEIVKYEKSYFLWPLAVLSFAPLSAWIKIIRPKDGSVFDTFSHDFSLALCLSLLIPAITDYIIETLVMWRRTKKAPFLGYLVFLTIPSVFLFAGETIYFCAAEENCNIINFIITLLTIFFSIYVYGAGKMLCNPDMQKYRTRSYFEEKREQLKKLESEANQKSSVDVNGKEIKL
jgi:hypothetical protein